LVTGGLGGLGLLVAEWLFEEGARHLVLMGRTEPSDEAGTRIRKLEEAGARVVVSRTDVSRETELGELFARVNDTMPPLRGVIHSAGLLDDGVLLQQTWDRFATVMAPKVEGAWLLHEMTRDRALDFFVLFSSVASLVGGSASGNHAAANAFLDALAHFRQSKGLPGESINWGAWSETGAAVRGAIGKRIEQRGLGFISPREGLTALQRVLQESRAQVGVMRLDWPSFLHEHGSHRRQPFFHELAESRPQDGATAGGFGSKAFDEPDRNLLDMLEEAYPNERRSLLVDRLEACVAKVLGLASTASIDRQQPLSEMGLDSLMAVELRNTLRGLVDRPLSATLLFDYPTVQSLSDYLATEVLGLGEISAVGYNVTENPDPEDLLDKIESMSEDEIDRLCADELNGGLHG